MDATDKPPGNARRFEAFFEAVKTGDLSRVKEMLADDPKLLFVDDLPTHASPSREALATGHDDVTDFLAHDELRRLADGTVPTEDLYGAIHDVGEIAHTETGYPRASELRAQAEHVVVRFLQHENEMLRYIALSVLGLHWNLRAHRETFRSMMFADFSEEVRRMAVACFGSVLGESRDWDATRVLLQKLNDRSEEASVRETAYEALLAVWFGFKAEHKFFLQVLNARKPVEAVSDEAGNRGEWGQSAEWSARAGQVWETVIDRDFIAALERGEEP